MPAGSSYSFGCSKDAAIHITDLPVKYGHMVAWKGFNDNYCFALFKGSDGRLYRYSYHSTGGTTNGWVELATTLGVAKIATGSYVGTGTYGAENPVSIVFGFTPKMVAVYRESDYIDGGTWVYGAAKGMMSPCAYENAFGETYYVESVYLTWDANSVSWYHTGSARQALNTLDATYRWVAIG